MALPARCRHKRHGTCKWQVMSGRHVLIVDDELIMREAVQLILDDQSYDTVTAANGVDGLNRLRQRAFDLMIVDLMLPDINGLEFIA